MKLIILKSYTFWDIASCNPVEVNRRVGRTCRRHLKRVEEKAKQEVNMKQAANRLSYPSQTSVTVKSIKIMKLYSVSKSREDQETQ
jgi:hypothetical protein